MLFNSFIFLFVFLPITYFVFWELRTAQSRYIWLTLTGYVFYGYWEPKFCLLMAFSTLVSYSAGLGFLRFQNARARLALLIIPIAVDLLLLGYFKYANFVIETLNFAFNSLGSSSSLPVMEIVLPIGISFYTFHTISYIVDCYRRTVQPTKNLFEFSAYVSLFSQLVAGPIVRYREIEADLEDLGRKKRSEWLAKGIAFFLVGMLEKVLIADTLSVWVDSAWPQYRSLSSVALLLMVFGYSLQLYFDFCGYSSMAVGLGFMFGVRIPKNFNSPYKALDPSDFWKRWHISLSSCLRDYVYIPLGGNRHGDWITNRNLLATMLLGGLWHGANWTFVVWGIYHGLLLVLYRQYSEKWDNWPVLLRQSVMFCLVCLGWVFFRSAHMGEAIGVIEGLFAFRSGLALESQGLFLFALLPAAYVGAFGPNVFDLFNNYRWRYWHAYGFAVLFGISLAMIASGGNSPFLYFQF